MPRSALFHVYRNTPFGRDTFLQSLHFAQKAHVPLRVYIPKHSQFLMYFPHRAVTVDLSKDFLHDSDTAKYRVEKLAEEHNLPVSFEVPTEFTALSLPDIPVSHKFMCCPRSISDLSTKIGLGYIGPKVRQIINHAAFPVLMPTAVFKEWKRIVVFFGGSNNAVRALETALSLRNECDCPLTLFTKAEGKPKDYYEEVLNKRNLYPLVQGLDDEWLFYEEGQMKELLFNIPSDALVVLGAYGHGHGMFKDMIMGSKMEMIQSVLPNNMLIVGPNCV